MAVVTARVTKTNVSGEATEVAVPVKSSFLSKINWTNFTGIIAGLLAYFGLNIPEAVLTEVILAIGTITQLVTMVFRTFFTKSVTTASVPEK